MTLLTVLAWLFRVLCTLAGALYGYHVFYTLLALLRPHTPADPPAPPRRYAALCCARNEQAVIASLVHSLRAQNYPKQLLDIYVMADNCTDDTARVAREAGATVFCRQDTAHVGKGYALDALLHSIWQLHGRHAYDGYFVFDADNLLDPNFIPHMNNTFSQGHSVVTSYRNSRNFSANWLSCGYAVWYLHEARFLSHPRRLLGSGGAVSGTGFLVSAELLQALGGWPFHLLTEDIQFSAHCAANAIHIAYCDAAVLYDEQPQSFSQSWRQRLRWSRGFYQVDRDYLLPLLKGTVKKGRTLHQRFCCFDLFMFILPGLLFSALSALAVLMLLGCALQQGAVSAASLLLRLARETARALLMSYGSMLALGLLTVLTEWRRIPEPPFRKLVWLPLFPLFMATYAPISLQALFCRVQWLPIRHGAPSSPLCEEMLGGKNAS
ncbi:MAG: glycosyltransferase family 2 protein [Oscillospiraceae bacterium]|nr:glycosyltransferase family 2 protein [Oscillospiraceae bacterium]